MSRPLPDRAFAASVAIIAWSALFLQYALLVRATLHGIGPALALFGIPDPLPAPVLTLATPPLGTISVPPSGSSNSVTPVAVATVAVGAFPLPTNSPDISIVTDFKPGPWSLIISGAPDASGTVLAEIYDARPDNEVGTTKLANLSVRAAVGEGTPLIGGFVIGGTATKRYLIRVPGPALASFNVPGAAPDTRLDLMDHTGTVVRSNDNWDAGPAADALELRQAFQRAGAFSFATGSRDAAIVASLAPGLYTVAAYQVGPTGGVALLEIYALDN